MAIPLFGQKKNGIRYFDTTHGVYINFTVDEILKMIDDFGQAIMNQFIYSPPVPNPSPPNNVSGLFNEATNSQSTMAHENITMFLQPDYIVEVMNMEYNPTTATEIQQRLHAKMLEFGWGEEHWGALYNIVSHESSFNPNAQNPRSTAYGLFQFLDGTWNNSYEGTLGYFKTSDVDIQIEAGLSRIKNRAGGSGPGSYGTPTAAWDFWQKNNWY